MSSDAFKPVMTDETAMLLVEAMRSDNVTHREIRDLIFDQNDILKEIRNGATPMLLIPVAYDGSAYSLSGITVAEIKAAIADGLSPVICIMYNANLYLIPHSRTLTSGDNVLGLQFDTDANCPDGSIGILSIVYSAGKVNKGNSDELSDVCKNVTIRIGENAAKAVIRERLRLAQAILGNLICDTTALTGL